MAGRENSINCFKIAANPSVFLEEEKIKLLPKYLGLCERSPMSKYLGICERSPVSTPKRIGAIYLAATATLSNCEYDTY
jgi:hypothetical protein